MSTEGSKKNISQNRRARHDYFIEEVVEAGVVLVGSEVKSLRQGHCNIKDAFAEEREGEIYLINMHVDEYTGSNRFNHELKRPRKLLLHRRQINKVIGATQRKGVTVIPLSIYFNSRGRVKVELAFAKGKKLYDKRASEKEKDWNKEKARILRERN